jgi:hypothetical protein
MREMVADYEVCLLLQATNIRWVAVPTRSAFGVKFLGGAYWRGCFHRAAALVVQRVIRSRDRCHYLGTAVLKVTILSRFIVRSGVRHNTANYLLGNGMRKNTV